MKHLLFALGLALAAASLHADPASAAPGDAPVQLDGLSVQPAQLQFTEKPDYIYALVDLYPFRGQLKADPARLARIAAALADGPVAQRYPAAKAVKVALIELPENDTYGAPMWSSAVILARYYGERSGKGFKLEPDKGKGAKAPKAVKAAKPAKAKAPAPAKP